MPFYSHTSAEGVVVAVHLSDAVEVGVAVVALMVVDE